jgi:hypothetical protein
MSAEFAIYHSVLVTQSLRSYFANKFLSAIFFHVIDAKNDSEEMFFY